MSDTTVRWVDLRPRDDAAAVEAAIRRVIEAGWFVLGPEGDAFETEFAEVTNGGQTVGVASGTDALTLTLRALGIGTGDEVITTALSAVYSAQAIVMAGAHPVFADIDPSRLTLDPAAVEALVGPKTAAIMPVHLYGQPADLPALATVADRHGLAIIEDCCQAHLATCREAPVGTVGVAAAYSFYPTKNLGALGDGGAITTRDSQLEMRLRRLRNGGQTTRNRHTEPSAHSRLDEIQAASPAVATELDRPTTGYRGTVPRWVSERFRTGTGQPRHWARVSLVPHPHRWTRRVSGASPRPQDRNSGALPGTDPGAARLCFRQPGPVPHYRHRM